MRELASSSLTYEFLRTLFLQRLPSEMQGILSVSSESLDNLTKMADKKADVRTDSVSGTVYSISGRCRGEQSSDSPLNEMAALRSQIASLSQQVRGCHMRAQEIVRGADILNRRDVIMNIKVTENYVSIIQS